MKKENLGIKACHKTITSECCGVHGSPTNAFNAAKAEMIEKFLESWEAWKDKGVKIHLVMYIEPTSKN